MNGLTSPLRTSRTVVMLTPAEKARLRREAARRTLVSGERVTISDLMRDAVLSNLPNTDKESL